SAIEAGQIDVSLEDPDLLACCDIPQANRVVIAAGDQPLGISGKGNGIDRSRISLEDANRFSGGNVPQASGVVEANRRDFVLGFIDLEQDGAAAAGDEPLGVAR